jgi:hypothetical protein
MNETIKKLKKAYQKVVVASTEEDRTTASEALRTLCETHKVDLREYIQDLPKELQFDYKKKLREKPTSRRAAILSMVQEGIWDIPTLAEALNILNDNWPESANRRAISGTLSDMRRHRKWIVDSCEGNRIVIREWI